MRNLKIDTKGDKMILTLNRKGFDQDYLIALIKRLQVEELAQKAGFTGKVEKVADELNQKWWDEHGDSFLTGVDK